jgi:hypothetical protein
MTPCKPTTKENPMRNLHLAAAVIAATASPAISQCFTASYGPAAATSAQLTGDLVLPIQPIGFAFPLGGTTYTDLHVCDKGYVYLSNAGVPTPGGADYTATSGELASQGPRIAPLWSDFQVLGASGGMIYVDANPARCVVTWENIQCYGGSCTPFSMQLQMTPSGTVSFFYSQGATNYSLGGNPAWSAGVAGISPGATTATFSSDLSATTAVTTGLVFEEWLTPATFDLGSSGVVFVPSAPGWVATPPSGCARLSTYGSGCGSKYDSSYEAFQAGNFDLTGAALNWIRGTDGYTLINALPSQFVAPSPNAAPVAAGADDGEELLTFSAAMPTPTGTTSSINVNTNGVVEFTAASTGNTDYSPTVQELLDSPTTSFACWHDYNQTAAGSGSILFEESGGVAYLTWDDVASYGGAGPNRFQFQFDLNSGNVALVMDQMAGALASGNLLVGYSAAGSSADPGQADLSAVGLAADISDNQQLPLSLNADSLPRVGNANFTFQVRDIPNLVPITFLMVGDSAIDPGLDLTSIGMPGCQGYTNGNLTTAAVNAQLPAGSADRTMPIPANPAVVGVAITVQALAFSLENSANLISSNGLDMVVGN